jgi:hypothetical protein
MTRSEVIQREPTTSVPSDMTSASRPVTSSTPASSSRPPTVRLIVVPKAASGTGS